MENIQTRKFAVTATTQTTRGCSQYGFLLLLLLLLLSLIDCICYCFHCEGPPRSGHSPGSAVWASGGTGDPSSGGGAGHRGGLPGSVLHRPGSGGRRRWGKQLWTVSRSQWELGQQINHNIEWVNEASMHGCLSGYNYWAIFWLLPTHGKDGWREAGLCASEASKEHFLISLLKHNMIYKYLNG